MYTYRKDGMENSIEAAFYCGLMQLVLTMYFTATDTPSMLSVENHIYGFFGSLLMSLC